MDSPKDDKLPLKQLATSITIAALASHRPPDNAAGYLKEIYDTLARLGQPEEPVERKEPETTAIPLSPAEVKRSIGKDSITCLLCGATMRVLTKHLREAHGWTPQQYRERFGIAPTQSLAAKSLSEAKRQQALNLNLSKHLKKKPGQSKKKPKTPDLGLD